MYTSRSNLTFFLSFHVAPTTELVAVRNDATNGSLEARSGNPTITVYSGLGCGGTELSFLQIPKCQRVCHSVSGIRGSLLMIDSTSNPKPTADFFTSSDCSGSSFQHTWIGAGTTSCSNINPVANSFYAYYNC